MGTGEQTNNAEDKLAQLAQRGDKAAEEELLHKYAPLVRSAARRYFLQGGETEDLIRFKRNAFRFR